ncbi:MAG TPA: hypothetical protein PL124_08540 [Candidatus Cloacimonadota bacterium]|nr:hypothetical protein [Candidatus Cloacimonadota bacterium]
MKQPTKPKPRKPSVKAPKTPKVRFTINHEALTINQSIGVDLETLNRFMTEIKAYGNGKKISDILQYVITRMENEPEFFAYAGMNLVLTLVK